MHDGYFCPRCRQRHGLRSAIGAEHIRYALDKDQLGRYAEFTANAGSYAYITSQTAQYVRDVQVFDTLGDKFVASGDFRNLESAQEWLSRSLSRSSDNTDHILRVLQGHGGGEVDALRAINGSLRSIFHRAEFIADHSGHVASNTPGVDLQIVNRFTGEVVERVQVKSNWSTDASTLRQTVDKFLHNASYDQNVTLAGPQELIDQAREMGVPNRLVVLGDAEGNRLSGERLKGLIENGASAVDGEITLLGVAERVGQGVLVGAAVTATVESFGAYIAWRNGEIDGVEAFRRIGVSASRGAVVGGAMAGLSVVFPPGAVGIAIGVAVGSAVRRIVDIAYGRGAYQDLVTSMEAVEASLAATTRGIEVLEASTRFAAMCQESTVRDLEAFHVVAGDTDRKLERLAAFRRGLR